MPVLNPIEAADRGALGDLPAALAGGLSAAREAFYDAQGNRFDYARFARSAELESLRATAGALAAFDCARLGVGARLPFWLNVYNALGLHAVAAQGGSAPARLDKDFFTDSKYRIAGHEFSLDDIEHGLIRINAPRFRGMRGQMPARDPRLALAPYLFDERSHFAMHSACRSSPRLHVWAQDALGAMLETAARDYVREHARVEDGGAVLRVAKIFQWYQGDFGGEDGVRAFVIDRIESEADIEVLERRGGKCALRYAEFDWTVNQR